MAARREEDTGLPATLKRADSELWRRVSSQPRWSCNRSSLEHTVTKGVEAATVCEAASIVAMKPVCLGASGVLAVLDRLAELHSAELSTMSYGGASVELSLLTNLARDLVGFVRACVDTPVRSCLLSEQMSTKALASAREIEAAMKALSGDEFASTDLRRDLRQARQEVRRIYEQSMWVVDLPVAMSVALRALSIDDLVDELAKASLVADEGDARKQLATLADELPAEVPPDLARLCQYLNDSTLPTDGDDQTSRSGTPPASTGSSRTESSATTSRTTTAVDDGNDGRPASQPRTSTTSGPAPAATTATTTTTTTPEPPLEFLCPITRKIMEEPMLLLTESGTSFERSALVARLRVVPNVDPATGEAYDTALSFLPNRALRELIERWRRTVGRDAVDDTVDDRELALLRASRVYSSSDFDATKKHRITPPYRHSRTHVPVGSRDVPAIPEEVPDESRSSDPGPSSSRSSDPGPSPVETVQKKRPSIFKGLKRAKELVVGVAASISPHRRGSSRSSDGGDEDTDQPPARPDASPMHTPPTSRKPKGGRAESRGSPQGLRGSSVASDDPRLRADAVGPAPGESEYSLRCTDGSRHESENPLPRDSSRPLPLDQSDYSIVCRDGSRDDIARHPSIISAEPPPRASPPRTQRFHYPIVRPSPPHYVARSLSDEDLAGRVFSEPPDDVQIDVEHSDNAGVVPWLDESPEFARRNSSSDDLTKTGLIFPEAPRDDDAEPRDTRLMMRWLSRGSVDFDLVPMVPPPAAAPPPPPGGQPRRGDVVRL